ncbi:MAG: hypothetical protein NTY36_17480 [Deltaproteobacteria bacterium]|nr:hypothetical protein [Deltaproteobacteria bacterium]
MEPVEMKTLCAWCGVVLPDGTSNGRSGQEICVPCAVKFEVEAISLEIMSRFWSDQQCGECLSRQDFLARAYSRENGCVSCRTNRASGDDYNNYQGE